MQQELTDQLCKNTIFEGLTQEQIADILPCIVAAIKTYGTEEFIYDKGERIRDLGVVLDGTVRVCNEDLSGNMTTLASIEKNGLFGEAMMFATGQEGSNRFIADKNAQVMYLAGDFFLSPCDKDCQKREAHQEIVKNMLRILSDKTIMLNKKIVYLTAPDLKTKIAMYLCELYGLSGSKKFHMPLNRDRLAEFFSVARPSLSRELMNLKNMGIIDFYRSNVEILDLDKLYETARNKDQRV